LFAVVCGHGGDGCAQRDLLADLNEPWAEQVVASGSLICIALAI
jgi:hypothetical protein